MLQSYSQTNTFAREAWLGNERSKLHRRASSVTHLIVEIAEIILDQQWSLLRIGWECEVEEVWSKQTRNNSMLEVPTAASPAAMNNDDGT